MLPEGKRLMLVAHPDDESLFGAGLMLRYPGDWTVICCSTPKKDPIRAWEFYSACEVLGAVGRTFPLFEGLGTAFDHLHQISLDKFDVVVTHNDAGEYGHSHHVAVNAHVMTNYKGPVWRFGYGVAPGNCDAEVFLTETEYERKMRALKCYNNPFVMKGVAMPTWKALLKYFPQFDFAVERYVIRS